MLVTLLALVALAVGTLHSGRRLSDAVLDARHGIPEAAARLVAAADGASSNSSSSAGAAGAAAAAERLPGADQREVWARGPGDSLFDAEHTRALRALLTADELAQLRALCGRCLYHRWGAGPCGQRRACPQSWCAEPRLAITCMDCCALPCTTAACSTSYTSTSLAEATCTLRLEILTPRCGGKGGGRLCMLLCCALQRRGLPLPLITAA